MSAALPDTVPVELIHDDALAVLRDRSGVLHPDTKILLASLLFSDDEGVAHVQARALGRWCALPGTSAARPEFLAQRVGVLTDGGLLAPGSTIQELRSMVGRRGDRA